MSTDEHYNGEAPPSNTDARLSSTVVAVVVVAFGLTGLFAGSLIAEAIRLWRHPSPAEGTSVTAAIAGNLIPSCLAVLMLVWASRADSGYLFPRFFRRNHQATAQHSGSGQVPAAGDRPGGRVSWFSLAQIRTTVLWTVAVFGVVYMGIGYYSQRVVGWLAIPDANPSHFADEQPVASIVSSIGAGLGEEIFLLAIPVVALDVLLRPAEKTPERPWRYWCGIGLVVVIFRIGIHWYHGWAAVEYIPWAVALAFVFIRWGQLVPLIIAHIASDLVVRFVPDDHFWDVVWFSFLAGLMVLMVLAAKGEFRQASRDDSPQQSRFTRLTVKVNAWLRNDRAVLWGIIIIFGGALLMTAFAKLSSECVWLSFPHLVECASEEGADLMEGVVCLLFGGQVIWGSVITLLAYRPAFRDRCDARVRFTMRLWRMRGIFLGAGVAAVAIVVGTLDRGPANSLWIWGLAAGALLYGQWVFEKGILVNRVPVRPITVRKLLREFGDLD